MRAWRNSLRLRLTVLFTLVNLCVLAMLAIAVCRMMEARMRVGLDHELKRDFDVIRSAMEFDHGKLEWELDESGKPPDFDFEARGRSNRILIAHGQSITEPDAWPAGAELRYSTDRKTSPQIRLIEGVTVVDGQELLLRVQRSLGELEQTLSGIIGVFAGTIPVAVLLAAVAGYWVADRSLKPVNAIQRQAARISASSLSERLPVANPDDEIGRLARVFNETFERLERSFNEMRRFTADASHELRTPLTALRVTGEAALREGGDVAAKDETIGAMLEEADRLIDLIEALLELARCDGGANLEFEEVQPAELLEEVADLLEVLAKDLEVDLRLEAVEQCMVMANRQLLRQAILNIVHNAIRHSPQGEAVLLSVYCREGWAWIEVVDRGPGITPEHQARVFDRFYRIDKSRSRSVGGFGLGLAIARQSVERMNGNIQLKSTPGQGARFVIRLAIADSASLPRV